VQCYKWRAAGRKGVCTKFSYAKES